MSPPWSIEEFETHGHTDDKRRGQDMKMRRGSAENKGQS